MIKILIVDDHPIVREGLKRIVSDSIDKSAITEADNGQKALEEVRKNDYNVVLMDISMPGICGIDIVKQMRSERPRLPILILSLLPEEQYAVRALRAGASGYLTKNSAPDRLITAIHKVLQGGTYVSPSLAEKLASELGPDENRPIHERLSDREYQVLTMISSGKTVKGIADELCLSVKTVSTFRTRILTKMDLKTTAELIHYAINHGLVEKMK